MNRSKELAVDCIHILCMQKTTDLWRTPTKRLGESEAESLNAT